MTDFHDALSDAPTGRDDRPESTNCADCGRTVDPVQSIDGTWFPPPERCEACDDQHRRRQLEKSQLREGFQSAWRAAGIPPKVRDVVESGVGWSNRLSRLARQMIRQPPIDPPEPHSCWIYGPVGTGKTTLAVAIGYYALHHWRIDKWDRVEEYGEDYNPQWELVSLRFTTVPKLFARAQDSFDDPGADSPFAEYQEADILILDEVGREQAGRSGWRAEQLYLLIDERYQARRPTIFTSNFALPELPDRHLDRISGRTTHYDDRIQRRIAEMVGLDDDDERIVELIERRR